MPKNLSSGLGVVDGNLINQILNQIFTASSGLTATAGGGLANALQLASGMNQIDVVATTGDSVKLPAAVANPDFGISLCMVFNNDAGETLDVYPQNSTDQILALGAGAADTLAAGKTAIYFCAKNGTWAKVLTA